MNQRTIYILAILAAFLVCNLIPLWILTHQYTFQTTADGQMIYRFNHLTGRAWLATPQYTIWTPITETNK